MAESPLTASLAALSRFFVGDSSIEQTLSRVAELTVAAIPGADLVGITMMVGGSHSTAIFTDATAVEVDQAQYESGAGPCLSALHEMRVTQIDSTREPGPWPEFRTVAAADGIGSTMSFPMVIDKTAVGAMSVYSHLERGFDDADRDNGGLFVSQAAIVLANARAYWDAEELSVGLGEAMKSRAVIEQAKGILMAAQGIDEDDAFHVLIQASQRENVKLRDIATRIVTDAVEHGRVTTDRGTERV